mmetsp:Transcript_13795/g.20322  ORF Transcript_13795/g.20322 Transcript_13795/m.20322 type:complete len:249 (-) Transcript_13795:1330-2076(-)
MRILVPPVRAGSLHTQHRHARGEHTQAIVLRLLVKQLLAGHGHHPHPPHVLGIAVQHLRRRRAQVHLRTCGHHDQVRLLGAAGLHHRVPAQRNLGLVRAGEVGHRLPRHAQDAGGLGQRQRAGVAPRRLVPVRRSEGVQVGHCPETLQGLNRLVGWAVLPERNAVVGHDEEHRELGQGRQAHSAHGVPNEVEEGGDKRADSSVGRHPVGDGNHAVLADPVPQVPPLRVSGAEVAGTFHPGEVGGREVG